MYVEDERSRGIFRVLLLRAAGDGLICYLADSALGEKCGADGTFSYSEKQKADGVNEEGRVCLQGWLLKRNHLLIDG